MKISDLKKFLELFETQSQEDLTVQVSVYETLNFYDSSDAIRYVVEINEPNGRDKILNYNKGVAEKWALTQKAGEKVPAQVDWEKEIQRQNSPNEMLSSSEEEKN